MAYVVLDADVVTGMFANPQPGLVGFATIADDDPRIAQFQAKLNPAKPQRVTGTEFINRFTPSEQQALATAALSDRNMLLMMIRLAAAGDVDLNDPDVQAGVNGLVGSVLTAPRAAAILDH